MIELPERCDCKKLKIVWYSPTQFDWVDTERKLRTSHEGPAHKESVDWARQLLNLCECNKEEKRQT